MKSTAPSYSNAYIHNHVICFINSPKVPPPHLWGAAAAAAAAASMRLLTLSMEPDVADLAPLSVTSQLLWPSATTNYGGQRPQIESL